MLEAVRLSVSPEIEQQILTVRWPGITPIYQVLCEILRDDADTTTVWLICANKTVSDVLMRKELDAMVALHGTQRLRLYHTLTRAAAEGWPQGRVDDEMMSMHLPPPSSENLVLACGPPAMIDETVKPGLRRIGWNIDEQLVVF